MILFEDAFQVVSSYSAPKKEHKLIGTYMTVANIPAYLRTHINTVQLVALVHEKYFNHKKVYDVIKRDLSILEKKGVQLSPELTVKGGLLFIAADNFGNHSVAGLVQNFSLAEYLCRFCYITREEFEKLYADKTLFYIPVYKNFRTVDSYNEDLNSLKSQQNCKGSKNNYKGVKFDSVFNGLESYHAFKNGLPPCLGHDLIEGVIARDLFLLINLLVKEGWFSYYDLNYLIKNFPLIKEDGRNKPNEIDEKCDRIKGNAWEIRTLLRFLPLIIETKIKNPHSEVWKCILLLTEISEIIIAPEIHKSFLPYLQEIIDEYLYLRVKLFPLIPLRPKHHYLSHYAFLLSQFGVLIQVWTLRFEGKHAFFKQMMRILHNYKNLTGSLAIKHELYQMLLRSGFDDTNYLMEKGELNEFNPDSYNEDIKKAIRECILTTNTFLSECYSIKLKGTNYKAGDILVTSIIHYEHDIQVGKIILILIDQNDIVTFVVEDLKTYFHSDKRIYEINHLEKKTY